SNGRTLNQKELEQLIDASQERLLKIQELEQIQQLQEALAPPQQSPDESQPMGEQPAPAQPIEQPAPTQPPEDDRLTLFDDGQPGTIIDKKEIKHHKIKHYQISGDYILGETDFPSDQLPLLFVDQAIWYDKSGQQICRPFIIDAKDTQKYLNYLATQSAYLLKVSRYDQWIGSKRNVASSDTQQKWRDPLIVQGILTFDESDSGVIPQQVRPPELPQSLVTQYQRAIEDLYTGTGLYPTRMGQQGNEVSGAAIDARTRQGSYATFPAFNSINRAIAVR